MVAECPQPLGACCFDKGTCGVMTEEQCTDAEGDYLGDDTGCEPNFCLQPDVACCFASGLCQMKTAAECQALGGQPGEYGTTCTPNDCPPCTGDLNCDGTVNFGDINPFVLILSNFQVWQQTYSGCPWQNGDIDGNGSPGFEDINPFVGLIVQSPTECQY
jgi:hypothetical protein